MRSYFKIYWKNQAGFPAGKWYSHIGQVPGQQPDLIWFVQCGGDAFGSLGHKDVIVRCLNYFESHKFEEYNPGVQLSTLWSTEGSPFAFGDYKTHPKF
jgi:hypothetical protein